MNVKRTKKYGARISTIFARNDARFMDIYHRSMSLDVLTYLPPFTTKHYASQDYFKVLEYASLSNISITQTCDVKRRLGERAPSAEQVLKCCRSTPSAMMSSFVNDALKCQFNALPKKLQQQLRKSGIIFIDFHQDPYYGEKTNPHVKVSKVKASTNRFYEYLTADLYSKHGSFTIAMIHRPAQITIKSLVEQLLKRIERIITPRILIFDGEFSSIATLAFLTQKHIKFIARKSRSHAIKAHLVAHYTMSDWERFRAWHRVRLKSWRSRVKRVCVDVCPHNVNGQMKTLIKSLEWKITPQYAEHLYAKRFNIETGYRTKHIFQAFTCTKSLSTRLLILFVAAFLWNCWQTLLIWIRSLKSFTKSLPRSLRVTLSATWIKIILQRAWHR